MTSLGVVALSYVINLYLPTALTDNGITYDSLIDQLRLHLCKKVAVLATRLEFIAIRLNESNSLKEFAAALRLAAVNF